MKKYLLILLIIFYCLSLSAQSITGSILDQTTRENLAGASVVLEGVGLIKTVLKSESKFIFKDLQPGKYILKVSHIGFATFQKELEVLGSDINLAIELQGSFKRLQEIRVVSASRQYSSSFGLPYAINVINQPSQSANMPRSTPEALANVPGVFVQKTNHGGGSAFIRGLTGNQTLILIDGIRMNNSTFRYGPNQYLNTIDPFTIQQIEVLRGSGSVQYGSDALGGVIQVFAKEPVFSDQKNFNGSVNARYWNSNMEKTANAELNYSGTKISFSGIVSIKDFGDLVGGDTTGRQSPSGYTEADAHFKARFKISESAELTLANQFVQQKNVDVYHKVRLENFKLNEMGIQNRNLSYLKLRVKNSNPAFHQLNIIASLNNTLEERNSQKNNSLILTNETDKISTANLSVELFSTLSDYWTANSGTEFYYDKIWSSRKTTNNQNGSMASIRGLYPDKSSYLNASIYTLQHLNLGRFSIEAGARYNWLKASLKDKDLGQINVNPAAFVLNAAINYSLNKHHFYGSFNSGYRAPNIDDMGTLGIVDFRYELPSYELKPEKSYNSETGYKYGTENWNLGMALYYNSLINLITRIQTGGEIGGYKVYRKVNTEKASIKGIEGFLVWRANKQFTIDGFASFNYGQNLTKSEPLRRIPPFNGHLSAKYNLAEFYLKGEVAWADNQSRLAKGDMEDNRIPLGGTPGWQVFNLYSGYNLKPFQVRLSGQNILNADYRTHGSGINSVGRSFWMSLQYDF